MAYQIFNIGVNSRRWLARWYATSGAITVRPSCMWAPRRSTRRYSYRTRQSAPKVDVAVRYSPDRGHRPRVGHYTGRPASRAGSASASARPAVAQAAPTMGNMSHLHVHRPARRSHHGRRRLHRSFHWGQGV